MNELVRIIFIGLIAHMDLAHTNTAVMVNVAGHEARMKIFHADGTVEPEVDLTGAFVRIGAGLGSSVPNRTLTNGKVPQLGDITEGKCQVRQEITDHKPDASVSAYIDYEGGILQPWAFQDFQILFDHGTFSRNPHCAACGTALNLVINGGGQIDIVVKNSTTKTYVVTETDIVVFRNAPPPGTASTGVSHFPHFYELLESGCSIKDDVKQAVYLSGAQAGKPMKCLDSTRCTDLRPLTSLVKTKTRTLHTRKIDWSRLNKKDFIDFIVTPDIECTNSGFP
jgi:hypothetical protein